MIRFRGTWYTYGHDTWPSDFSALLCQDLGLHEAQTEVRILLPLFVSDTSASARSISGVISHPATGNRRGNMNHRTDKDVKIISDREEAERISATTAKGNTIYVNDAEKVVADAMERSSKVGVNSQKMEVVYIECTSN